MGEQGGTVELPFLVEKLNAPPFNLNETIVTLSEKIAQSSSVGRGGGSAVSVQGSTSGSHDASAAHQLLSDLFTRISPETHPKVDVNNEAIEETVRRITAFLRQIKYRSDEDELTFREGIASCDSHIILAVLKHLVQTPEQLKKRAFVGFYLSDIQLPDDVANDEDVLQISDAIRILQQDFIRLHRASEQAKGVAKDPMKLRSRIPELENEKGQLKDKLEKTKAKLSAVAGLDKMLKLSSDLRKEQETVKQLDSSLQQQKQHLHLAETRYQRLATRMRELQTTAANGSSAAFLSQLEEETASCRVTAREKLPKELEAKRARLESIKEVLGSSLSSESDLQTLLSLRERIQGEVTGLVDRRNQLKTQLGERVGLQLRQQMQMANVIAKKREDTIARYERLSLKRADLTKEYNNIAGGEEDTSDIDLHSEDVQRKMESVKEKLIIYKSQKRTLEAKQAELLTLQHTFDILAEQEKSARHRLEEAEEIDGVSGAANMIADLERVSVAKSEIDQVKGEALEEISKVVVQITSTIKSRKEDLAPKIKELRTLRQMAQSVEDEHKARSQEYQRALMSYQSRRARLDEEVGSYNADLRRDESRFHLLNCNALITDVQVQRCTQINESKRLQQKYENAIHVEEERSKDLKAMHRDTKGSVGPNKAHASTLDDIKQLLQCKLHMYKSGMNDSNNNNVTTTVTAGGADVMTFG